MNSVKPLGRKSYGHIMHLPGSRIGPGDHTCDAGMARIATEKLRDEFDRVIVQEKLDGSNVGVARLGDTILALVRAGHLAGSSPYEQHWHFDKWVRDNRRRFLDVLRDGERLCGEWLMQAHGTRYDLKHEPFVVFDLMREDMRAPYNELFGRLEGTGFTLPRLIHVGGPFPLAEAMAVLNASGHGALDPAEGAVWRVERNELKRRGDVMSGREWRVDFLAKYVRPDAEPGRYLPAVTGGGPVWNWQPEKL